MVRGRGLSDLQVRGTSLPIPHYVSSSWFRISFLHLLLVVPCVLSKAPSGGALLYIQQHSQAYDRELLEFARIPSISSMPQHLKDVQEAATWLVSRLKNAGLKVIRRMLRVTLGPIPRAPLLHPFLHEAYEFPDAKPLVLDCLWRACTIPPCTRVSLASPQ